jgi:plastocyanin
MSNSDFFYVIGSLLAVSAVAVSFLGLRMRQFPGRVFPVVVLWFAVLVGAATTFAVLNGKDEDAAHAAESTANEIEQEPNTIEPGTEGVGGKAAGEAEGGGGEEAKGGEEAGGKAANGGEAGKAKAGGAAASTTLKLAADPTQIAFDTTSLSAKAGKVTIDFTNPSALEHNVAIEQGGKVVATTPTFAEGEQSVSADLAPGTYTFLCTVPGHAEAGMEGTLTVK